MVERPETPGGGRPLRADARRNIEAVLEAAKVAFATTGVHTPVREIAAQAGVGTGTIYRHFPQRTDLVSAVFRRELDSCSGAAEVLLEQYDPMAALRHWLTQYVELLITKRGLVTAMHSDAPTYESLTECFQEPLRPSLQLLLDSAASAGQIRHYKHVDDLLQAVAALCLLDAEQAQRMVDLLVDGMRFGVLQ